MAVSVADKTVLHEALAGLVAGGGDVVLPDMPDARRNVAARLSKQAAALLEPSDGAPKGAPPHFVEHWLAGIARPEDENFGLADHWAGVLAHAAVRHTKRHDALVKKLAALTPTAADLFLAMFRQHAPDPEWAPPEDWELAIEEQMIAAIEGLPLRRASFETEEGPGAAIRPVQPEELLDIDLGGPAALAVYQVPAFVWARHWEWASAKWSAAGTRVQSRPGTFGAGSSVNVLVRLGLAKRFYERLIVGIGPLPGEAEQRVEVGHAHAALATPTAVELMRIARPPKGRT